MLATFAALFLLLLLAVHEGRATPLSDKAGLGKVGSSAEGVTDAPAKRCPASCGNGVCDPKTGLCRCNLGWRGDFCSLCGGKIRLNSTEGWLADAIGNYTVDTKCTWLIEAPEGAAGASSNNVRLHLKEFATECGWDHLYIFDGDSVFSDMKAVFSGMVRNDRYNIQRVPEVVGNSGKMLVHFYSDVAYNMTGFNITFSINSCPSDRHDLTCSGHGTCENGQCICDEDFKGDACDILACPNNCEPGGIKRGNCNHQIKKCECFEGWAGEACSQQVNRGYWQSINVSESRYLPTPRTSHSAMVDDKGVMWILGGETFGFSHSWDMVSTFTLGKGAAGAGSGQWRAIRAKGDKGPSPRYGHSAVMHENKIYMYGGTMRSGHTSRELWALDMDTYLWERVETVKGRCTGSGFGPRLCGPIHSMGHTATVQSNRMIVIFGHSPKYGYLNTVQEYHFKNKEWSLVPTSGYPVRGGFGHSAAWDEITKRIYVFGGYVSTAFTVASLSDNLYSYDPIAKRWALHSPPGSSGPLAAAAATSRYLHSAVVSAGMMVVFGGNTHNDTAWSYGAKCFSADVIAYDIACDKWHNMQADMPRHLSTDLARFGHSATMTGDGTMLVYGGFNGLLKSDVLAYVPGQCGAFKSKADCLGSSIGVGVKCVWNPKKSTCQKHPPNRLKTGVDFCLNDESDEKRNSEFCAGIDTCQGCASTSRGCVWCKNSCRYKQCGGGGGGGTNTKSGGGGSGKTRSGRVSSGFGGNGNGSSGGSDEKKNNNSGGGGINLAPAALESKDFSSGNGNSPSASSSSDFSGIWRVEECPQLSKKQTCQRHHICHSCVTADGCQWKDDKNFKCIEARSSATSGGKNNNNNNNNLAKTSRNSIHSAIVPLQKNSGVESTLLASSASNKNNASVGENDDVINNSAASSNKKPTSSESSEPVTSSFDVEVPTCGTACSEKKACLDCTRGKCMWCKNLHMCTDRNAYLASFPYGQCMDWTTQTNECPARKVNDTEDDICYGYQTCSSCRNDPACGWCDDGSGTGVGKCQVGGASGPLVKKSRPLGHVQWVAADTCSSSSSDKTWHFTSCPACQCNGHSLCVSGEGGASSSTCRQPCGNHTEGERCEKCARGYFGNPVNGGKCRPCECNGQATTCDHRNGRCNCTTKGIVGDKCQRCDQSSHYWGDPITGSCFYDLAIDYQFTFNLSKPDDRHLTGINFKNMPNKIDVDVDFSVYCSVNSKINLTAKYNIYNINIDPNDVSIEEQEEQILFSNLNCSEFKHRFSKDDYVFGRNFTSFYVYVYDIQPPMWVIISFSQHPKLDLLQFFITFSTCFLALLLVAAVLWKIKQKYDRYRRRQRLFVEMEQMASRPFGSVLVELEKLPETHLTTSSSAAASQPSSSSSSSRQQHQQQSFPTSGSSTSMVAAVTAAPSGCSSSAAAAAAQLTSTTSSGAVSSSEDSTKTTHVRRRRKKAKPSPIALEPCQGNRAAVLSLIVRLPTGGKPHAPNGCTGMAVASALVTLGNPRKPSAEPSAGKQFDDPKSGRKGRKGANSAATADI